MKKPVVSCYICFTLLICFAAVLAPAQQQGRTFRWSMALLNAKNGESVPFGEPVQSQTGEQFRLIINTAARSFLYVIAESANEEDVIVLYSGPMKNGETWNSGILVLTPPAGSESLFVITSLNEQRNLVQRIEAMNNNYGPSQKRAVINEIFRIRGEVSRFREAPEKPVLMGGASRGNPARNEGIEFSGLGTYVKTISIEH